MKVTKHISPHLFPNPCVLVTSKHEERESIITISWIGTVCSNPPMISISIRPNRYSHEIISLSKEFVVNFPATSNMLKYVKICGTKSGKDIDKWKVCNFTRGSSKVITTPFIEECPAAMECKVDQIIPLGSHDIFIAKIVALHVEDSWKEISYLGGLNYSGGIYFESLPID